MVAELLVFELVSPSALLVSEEVDMVVVPGSEGDIGVLAGHTPLISNLRPGVVDIHKNGSVLKSLFVEGGFTEITNERCTLLATDAVEVDRISADDSNARLETARLLIESTDEEAREKAEHELAKAEAMAYAVRTRSKK